jgi:hypothetical protein
MRLKEIAERVLKQYGGDLHEGLNGLSVRQARSALKQFPNIADPGANRILLFAGFRLWQRSRPTALTFWSVSRQVKSQRTMAGPTAKHNN